MAAMTILSRISVALLIGLLASCGEEPQPVASDQVALESETSPAVEAAAEASNGTAAANPIATPKGKDPFRFQVVHRFSLADWSLMTIHQQEMRLKGVEMSMGVYGTGMFRVADREKFRSEDLVAALKKARLGDVSVTKASSDYYQARGRRFG